ncbi:MAG: hypothetical protein O7B25_12425 [Gammaproteobacteria bacterium]|nr:hypothetical protein [Gammaproteobacteria bacterium]
MSLAWLFRFADRTHPLLLPGLLMLGSFTLYITVASLTEGGQVRDAIGERSFAGTLALFSLLPGYLLAMMSLQRRRTIQALAAFEPSRDTAQIQSVRNRLDRLHPMALLGVAAGMIFGVQQNLNFVDEMYQQISLNAMDIAFIGGNCFVWGFIAMVLCWRVPVSIGVSRLGEAMVLDIYRLDKLKPLARLATTDILVVAGGFVLMPLQSLDAEFRMGNYTAGLIVGVPSAAILFLLPLWGLHKNIRRSKVQRLQSLRARLDEVDRQDVPLLETLTAHIDRVRMLPDWPIDMQTVTRVFAYVIIPPLAWVGAALVENFVNSF